MITIKIEIYVLVIFVNFVRSVCPGTIDSRGDLTTISSLNSLQNTQNKCEHFLIFLIL